MYIKVPVRIASARNFLEMTAAIQIDFYRYKRRKSELKGDYVKINYVGTFDDGTVFDSTEKKGEPLVFRIGDEDLL